MENVNDTTRNQSDDEYDETNLPLMNTWLLDPTYSSFRKLLIVVIRNNIVKVNHTDVFLYYLCNRPVSKVEIMGRVISIQIRLKNITYYIDDGTGMMRCTKFLNIKATDTTNQVVNAISGSNSFEVGDLVSVRGTIVLSESNSDHYGYNIHISWIEMIMDDNVETYHWMCCVDLFKKEYSLPLSFR